MIRVGTMGSIHQGLLKLSLSEFLNVTNDLHREDAEIKKVLTDLHANANPTATKAKETGKNKPAVAETTAPSVADGGHDTGETA